MASKRALRGLFVVWGVCESVIRMTGIDRNPDVRHKIVNWKLFELAAYLFFFMMDSG